MYVEPDFEKKTANHCHGIVSTYDILQINIALLASLTVHKVLYFKQLYAHLT